MSTTIGCPIPGASQPKEPVRLVDANSILRSIDVNGSAYDGSEYQAYKSGVEYVRSLIEDAPAIKPESMRHEKEWISVKDRLPDPNEKVIVYNAENDGTFFARRLVSRFEWWDWVTKEYINWRWLPYGYTNIMLESVTHWMPLPKPPKETNDEQN